MDTQNKRVIDTYYSDQICYVSDVDRANAVCFSISNAVELFKKSYLYNFYDNVMQEVAIGQQAMQAGISLSQFPHSRHKDLLVRELVFDNFLIGTAFELLGKAFLLDAGCLVHIIIRDDNNPKSIARLHKSQQKRPVTIDNYLLHDSFREYNQEGKNSLQYLTLKTVSYGTVYGESAYTNILPFSDNFVEQANRYRELRNMIHFPVRGASEVEIALEPLDLVVAYSTMRTEWDLVIRPRFEALKQQHGVLLNVPTF